MVVASHVHAEPTLELLAPVTLSAVCFRHRSVDNEVLRKSVLRRGKVYLSNATIGGHFALRACFVNHRTVEADVRSIVEQVMAAAGD